MSERVWVRQARRAGRLEVGFTKSFLEELRENSYGIIENHRLIKGRSFLFAEMSYGTLSVEAPVSGTVVDINRYLHTCFEKITEDTMVFLVEEAV